MINPSISHWVNQNFKAPIIPVKNNTYSASNAKITFTLLKILWLIYTGYIILHFYNGGEFDAVFTIMLFAAVFVTVIL